MADPLSVQLLSFNFASQTYAYLWLVQRLNKSVTGFSSFVRSFLESCLAATLCTEFMDDIGCGVETFEQMVPTLRQIFDCLRKSGLRLTPHKCEFGMPSINFLGNTITSKGLKPEKNWKVSENDKTSHHCEISEKTSWLYLIFSTISS